MVERIVFDAMLAGGVRRWFGPRLDVRALRPSGSTCVPVDWHLRNPAGRSTLVGPFATGTKVRVRTSWPLGGESDPRPVVLEVVGDAPVMYVRYRSRAVLPRRFWRRPEVSVEYVTDAPPPAS